MSETKQLRLGQIARKLNVGRNTIISFLHEKGYEVDSNPNTKINHDLFKILENAGIPEARVNTVEGEGLDVVTGDTVNMIKHGIIDPLLVTKSALQNASSVATTILSTDCVINNLRIGDESNR